MSDALICPGCGAALALHAESCKYCGHANPQRVKQAQERWLEAWTQGLAPGGYSNGNFELTEYPAMPLSQALEMLERLPIPPDVPDPGNYCYPTLGFDERCISRQLDGQYFLWPEDRFCTAEEARQVVLGIYGVSDSS